jgi:hypothetical protein
MGDESKRSKKKDASDIVENFVDNASTVIDTVSSTGAAIGAAIEAGAPIVVPFTKFLPIINEIGNIFNEIVELVEAAEHNKRTCVILKQRVYAADLALLDLRVQRDKEDRKDFFNNKNYLCLQNLSNIIAQIKKFIAEISQMKTLIKYIKAKTIEKKFNELCGEFDGYVGVLTFSINVKIVDELKQLKKDDELKQLKEDQDELAKVRLKN